jgi:hypothetical protein
LGAVGKVADTGLEAGWAPLAEIPTRPPILESTLDATLEEPMDHQVARENVAWQTSDQGNEGARRASGWVGTRG